MFHRGQTSATTRDYSEKLENEDPIEEKACRLLFTQRNITHVWFASAPPPKVAHLLLLTTHVMKPPPCCNGEVRARSGQGRLGRVRLGLGYGRSGQVMVMVGLGQVKVRLGQGRRVVSTTRRCLKVCGFGCVCGCGRVPHVAVCVAVCG